MIAIINYKAGNLASVSNALERLGAPHVITSELDALESADAIIFPGVGHAQAAMQSLHENNLAGWLRQTKKPLLGICLGMQLFFESSDEGDTECLGIIPGRLRLFDNANVKVPHMGWNHFSSVGNHPLLAGIDEKDYFYYVHGYYAPVTEYTIATCHYDAGFSSVVARDNFTGVQFHPEKSGANGVKLLQNFLEFAGAQTGPKNKLII
ncbi:MAG: imidazole glycerol phosphate synthase subunit HisH [Balneolaceae bacterium]|nr:MAG: imidazole glycerol phosphate synthase subunit HisH [Balneolaceae bacterium]